MKSLTLRILLQHLYQEETEKSVFSNPHKNMRSGFPSFPDMGDRHLLPACDELDSIRNQRRYSGGGGRAQDSILSQKNTKYRTSIKEKVKESPCYFDDYLKACQNWLQEEKYDPLLLQSRLIPWVSNYIPHEISLPITPFFKLSDAIPALLQPELPLQAHAEALMWLMLYAALGNDFQELQCTSSFVSILAQDLSLSREKEIDEISSYLTTNASGGRIVVLYSDGGIGKTYLAYQVFQKLQKRNISCLCYLNMGELKNDIGQLCKTTLPQNEPESIIFIDDAPLGFEHDPIFDKLALRGYRIVVTTRWPPQSKGIQFVLFPVLPFPPERLSRYFLSKVDASISQHRKDKMYSVVTEIAKKIDCNTDLFLLLQQLMCRHVFEPEELLEKLNQYQTQHIYFRKRPFCEYVYQLFFSHDFADTSDQQISYLCCMAFLPESGISYEQLHVLMKDIDPQGTILRELLEYGFLKAVLFEEPHWHAYANGQPIYYIHNNMRQAVTLSLTGLIDKTNLSEKLYTFLGNLENGLRTCQHMANTTAEEDQLRYLNLLFWQRIARFLIDDKTLPLLKLLPNKEFTSQLFCTISDLFYFASIYDDALIALDRAHEMGAYMEEDLDKRKWQIASVTGNKSTYSPKYTENDLMLWEYLRKENLWLPCCHSENKVRVLEKLGFVDMRTDVVLPYAKTLQEKAEELTENGWLVLRIHEQKNSVTLYSVQSQSLKIRRILLDLDENSIIELFQNTYILPKTSWKTTPQEMLREGLRRGRYDGWGVFRNSDKKLLSYVDIKVLRADEPGYAQIGFAATDVSARSQRLTQFLVNRIRLEYATRGTFFTTHMQNGSMRRVAGELGYQECSEREYNRIVEPVATLRYKKEPLAKQQ